MKDCKNMEHQDEMQSLADAYNIPISTDFLQPSVKQEQENSKFFFASHVRDFHTSAEFHCEVPRAKVSGETPSIKEEPLSSATDNFPTSAPCCEICHYRFISSDDATNHMKIHTGELSFEPLSNNDSCRNGTQRGETCVMTPDCQYKSESYSVEKLHLCNECGKFFTCYKQLQTHLKIHSKHEPFVCKVCGKAVGTSADLENHLQIHSAEKRHVCKKCGKSFSQSGTLKAHKRRVHTRKKKYECRECGSAFSTLTERRIHFRIHCEPEPHLCKYCGKSFPMYKDLKNHYEIHSKQKPYECVKCRLSFPRASHLRSHLHIHTDGKLRQCKDCGKRFAELRHLLKHAQTHTKVEIPSFEKSGSQTDEFANHQKIRDVKEPFKCQICGRPYTRAFDLRRHLLTHTEENHIKAKTGDELTHQSNLSTEVQTHTRDKLHGLRINSVKPAFKCQICGRPYTYAFDLRRHLLTHIEDIKAKTGDELTHQSNLSTEVQTHTRDKLHASRKSSSQADVLQNGLKINNGKQPFKYAGKNKNKTSRRKGCSQRSDLDNEVKNRTENKLHICIKCGKWFVSQSSLQRHLETH